MIQLWKSLNNVFTFGWVQMKCIKAKMSEDMSKMHYERMVLRGHYSWKKNESQLQKAIRIIRFPCWVRLVAFSFSFSVIFFVWHVFETCLWFVFSVVILLVYCIANKRQSVYFMPQPWNKWYVYCMLLLYTHRIKYIFSRKRNRKRRYKLYFNKFQSWMTDNVIF